jgi:5-formyltetrahydrofolate cyclo-ligase
LYKSLLHEFDLTSIIDVYPTIEFCFPKINDENMEFYLCNKDTSFLKNSKYNFLEPFSDIKTIPELLFVPGLRFDINGYRLGFGKGHYDKYFAKKFKLGYKFTLVGVSPYKLEIQIPIEPHDVKMDYLIFGSNILKI